MSTSASTDLEEQICTLWVHNEAFSKEDVLFNAASFPKAFASSTVFTLTPYTSRVGVRDFQILASASSNKGNHSIAASTTTTGRQSHRTKSSARLGRDRQAKCFTFAGIDMDGELKLKHPNLQVTCSVSVELTYPDATGPDLHIRKDLPSV